MASSRRPFSPRGGQAGGASTDNHDVAMAVGHEKMSNLECFLHSVGTPRQIVPGNHRSWRRTGRYSRLGSRVLAVVASSRLGFIEQISHPRGQVREAKRLGDEFDALVETSLVD